MARYVAFLRGVSPMNCKMAALARALSRGGLSDVKTVRSSGNAVFTARQQSEAALAKRAEAAMEADLGRSFLTLVRSVNSLQELLASDPFAAVELAPGSKRVVTFLREAPRAKLKLPAEVDGARIVAVSGLAVVTAYVPHPRGPAFMTLLEKTFGKNITTRTWETVAQCAR